VVIEASVNALEIVPTLKLVNARNLIKYAQAGAIGKKRTYYVDYVLCRNKKN